jgi:hypothetical protein
MNISTTIFVGLLTSATPLFLVWLWPRLRVMWSQRSMEGREHELAVITAEDYPTKMEERAWESLFAALYFIAFGLAYREFAILVGTSSPGQVKFSHYVVLVCFWFGSYFAGVGLQSVRRTRRRVIENLKNRLESEIQDMKSKSKPTANQTS